MQRSNSCRILPVVRWSTLPIEHKLHWLLRAGVYSKPALTAHYASIGLDTAGVCGFTATQVIGAFEIALALAVLVAPLPNLLIGICLWKMGTETLFMTSGSLPFEWIERAGSYMAPLSLYYLVVSQICRHSAVLCPRRPLTSSLAGAEDKARRGRKSLERCFSSPSGCPIKGSPTRRAHCL